VALGGAGLVVLGSLLPWATVDTVFGSVSRNGTSGDGKLTLVGGIAFALLYLRRERVHAIIATVVAFAILGVGFNAMRDVNDAISEVEGASDGLATAEVGIGLWLVMVGAGAMLVGIFGRTARFGAADKRSQL
jgi:hypothetical protein